MKKLHAGDTYIAHVVGDSWLSGKTVLARLNERTVEVVCPSTDGLSTAYNGDSQIAAPNPLILSTNIGHVTLMEGHFAGASGVLTGHGELRLKYYRAIRTGSKNVDYSEVNGMQSTVDGLAVWSNKSPVQGRLIHGPNNKLTGLNLEARNQDPIALGGSLNLEISISYSHVPQPKDGNFTISTNFSVKTTSSPTRPWEEHASSHLMIQDLMTLAYGRPCLADLKSVLREDDQPFEPKGERRVWHETFSPTFGRASLSAKGLEYKRGPLFYLSEVEPRLLDNWLTNDHLWSRSTWIGVTPIFHRDLPIESSLIQIAVALEALADAIARKKRIDVPRPYAKKLELICESLDFYPVQIFGSNSVEEWCEQFNRLYKGSKHADNPLPSPNEALEKYKEGLILLRCWLAMKLGVPPETLKERLNEDR